MRRPQFVSLIGLPFEASTTFLQGTVEGPRAILDDLEQLDGFDLRLRCDPFENVERRVQFAHDRELKDPYEQQRCAYSATKDVLLEGGFPLSIGGEHTVTLGPLKAVREFGKVGIVQLDAHADLRDSYLGNPMNHACAMRRALELDCPLLGIGIRAICGEDRLVMTRQSVSIVDGYRSKEQTDWFDMVDALPEKIYLTIDMDVLDPAEVSGVGTPEPGGMSFESVVRFLRHLFARKDVVGADIVELMPRDGDRVSVRAASRLLGLIVGLRFQGKGMDNT